MPLCAMSMHNSFKYLQGWGLHHFPGSPVQCSITLSVNKFFLISNVNLPWRNLRPFPLVLSLVTREKRPTPHFTTTSFQVAVASDKVSPQPPLLQTEQPQFSQLLLIKLGCGVSLRKSVKYCKISQLCFLTWKTGVLTHPLLLCNEAGTLAAVPSPGCGHWHPLPPTGSALLNHRIIESLTLEKTSKIIKSNHQPITTTPTKPSPEVPHLHVFWTPPGMVIPPVPWAACSNASQLFQWRNFS